MSPSHPPTPPAMSSTAARRWRAPVAALLALSLAGACGESLTIDDLPAEVTTLGPLSRSAEGVVLALTVFDYEGSDARVHVEWAPADTDTFTPIRVTGLADLNSLPVSRRAHTEFSVVWDTEADGLAPGQRVRLRAWGEGSTQTPVLLGPVPLP